MATFVKFNRIKLDITDSVQALGCIFDFTLIAVRYTHTNRHTLSNHALKSLSHTPEILMEKYDV